MRIVSPEFGAENTSTIYPNPVHYITFFWLQRCRNDSKYNFERSSQKEGSAGGSKRGSTGDPPCNFIVGPKHRKSSILESRIFIVVAFFPGNVVTIILDNDPASTLQGVGLD